MVQVNLKIKNYRKFFFKTKKVQINIPQDWAEVPKSIFEELYTLLPFAGQQWAQYKILSLFIPAKCIHFIEQSFLDQHFWANINKLSTEKQYTTPFTSFKYKLKTINARVLGFDFSIKLPFRNKYYLPKELLADLTCGEVAAGIKQITIFFNKEGQDEANLNKAVAIFCRQQKAWLFSTNRKDFKRSEFDIEESNDTAALFEKLSFAKKLFIIYYVLGNLDKLKNAPRIKILFPEPAKADEEENEAPKQKENKKKDPNIWLDFLANISETGIAGTFTEVQHSNFQEVLFLAAKKKQDIINQQRRERANR